MLFQQADNVVVQPLLCNITWQPIHVVSNISIGTMVQEGLCRLEAAFPAGQEQGCLVLVVLSIPVRPTGQPSKVFMASTLFTLAAQYRADFPFS